MTTRERRVSRELRQYCDHLLDKVDPMFMGAVPASMWGDDRRVMGSGKGRGIVWVSARIWAVTQDELRQAGLWERFRDWKVLQLEPRNPEDYPVWLAIRKDNLTVCVRLDASVRETVPEALLNR